MMAHAIKFDTLQFAKKLEGVGMPPQQAEKLAELQAEILDDSSSALVTKADLDVRISQLEATIIKWVVGIAFAQGALIVSLIKFIH